MVFLALLAGAVALRSYALRENSSVLLRIANAVLVAFVAWACWFALLFTGVVRLGWLTRWLGVARLNSTWTGITFFAPPLAAAAAYLIFAPTRNRHVETSLGGEPNAVRDSR